MLLIVGGNSEIGRAVHKAIPGSIATTRQTLDLSSDHWDIPEGITSAVICAAVTKLQACEADPEGTYRINVIKTLRLADQLKVPVLFISSNHVFDGTIPHVPPDFPHSPVSEYGRQKAHAERGFMARGHGILRLGKVLSPDTPLIRSWAEKIWHRQPIQAFSDLKMAPVYISEVCEAIVSLMGKSGVFQLTGERDISYLDFALGMADPSLVVPARAADLGFPAGFIRKHTTLQIRIE